MAPKQKPGLSKQDYTTPKVFIDATTKLLGINEFEFDFAADSTNSKGAGFWSEEDDSLSKSPQEWADKCLGYYSQWSYLNPPFGKIEPWVIACYQASLLRAHIACLLPASVGSNWFRDYVDGKARVLMLNGRLSFIPDKPTWLYPKDCMLLLYGPWQSGYQVWDWRGNGREANQV